MPERCTMRFLCLFLLAILVSSPAAAQSFPFTADEFLKRFNADLATDGIDTTRSCRQSRSDVECTFNDARFQDGLKAMKKLNLANGQFSQKKTLLITLEDKKVAEIILSGDRSDPINLFHFIASVRSVIKAIDPSVSEDAIKTTVDGLGLMRGDSNKTIGNPVNQIEDYGAIKCNNQHSRVSTTVGCVFVPRS